MGVDDTDGVVVETHADAIGFAHEIGVLHENLTVHLRLRRIALHGQLALAEALKSHQMVGYEAVGQRQREAGHREGCINDSLGIAVDGAIRTVQQSELLVIEQQTGLNSMCAIVLHQIYQLRAQISNG